ncbi:uncharacterized protein [Parasteatoda tepidariorum]|uniref:uncharacterized protein n=1 Tax=Parasteatoda tepidariorum TaxID=114398 RepID=UPI00077F8F7E|nr:TD and POZ domain-containing protein 2-like [Parasteatoda tepidariorum]
MACSNLNNFTDSNQCNCGNVFENEVFDIHLKTKRSTLNSYKLKWSLDDFSILPIGKIKSAEFHPLPRVTSHIELEIASDDLRIYLCLPGKDLFVNCDLCILDVNGQLLYQKSTTLDCVERFDLTDVTMRGCFAKLKSAPQDKLILSFYLKIHGVAVTDVCSLGSSGASCRINNLKKLSNDLMSAYKNSLNTDIKLNTSEGKAIAVHRAVLSARSSVFAKMFEYDMTESTQKEVNITDVAFDVLKKLVEFMYSAEVSDIADLDSAYELYYAADKYNVLDLRNLCGDVLMSKLTVDNACRTLARVDQHDDKYIRAKVIQYICLHLKEIVNSEDWDSYMDNRLSAEVINMSLAL